MNNVTINDVLPYISLLIAALAFFRNTKNDNKAEIVSITTVTNKLDTIQDGIREIKADFKEQMKEQKADILDLRDRMNDVENSCKSAHKRLDSMELKK